MRGDIDEMKMAAARLAEISHRVSYTPTGVCSGPPGRVVAQIHFGHIKGFYTADDTTIDDAFSDRCHSWLKLQIEEVLNGASSIIAALIQAEYEHNKYEEPDPWDD
jgi:hypothetical protein